MEYRKIVKNKLIKQDINFMEYPLYILNKNSIQKNILIKNDEKEFMLNVGYKTPNSTDMLFLYYFIKKSQELNYSEELILKRADVIKNTTANDSSYYYKRLEETLKIWRNVGLGFKNAFYNEKKYKSIDFGVLDHGKIEEDGTINIRINKIFIDIIKNSGFYRYVDFEEFKKLKKPVSRRLYEILKKSALPLKMEIINLAKKITLDKKYPSDIIVKIKPAIKEINKNTDLNIEFEYYKNENNETICEFTQKRVLKDYFEKFNEEQKEAFSKLEKIGLNETVIINIINKYPIERIKKIYKYTKEQKPVNCAGFFRAAIENDYIILTDDEKILKKKIAFLKKEALQKYKTVCHYGNCNARWNDYKDNEISICYWCKKFEDQRNNQLKLEI
jgi:hypothetical protein